MFALIVALTAVTLGNPEHTHWPSTIVIMQGPDGPEEMVIENRRLPDGRWRCLACREADKVFPADPFMKNGSPIPVKMELAQQPGLRGYTDVPTEEWYKPDERWLWPHDTSLFMPGASLPEPQQNVKLRESGTVDMDLDGHRFPRPRMSRDEDRPRGFNFHPSELYRGLSAEEPPVIRHAPYPRPAWMPDDMTLILLTIIVGLCIGWWLDRRNLKRQIANPFGGMAIMIVRRIDEPDDTEN